MGQLKICKHAAAVLGRVRNIKKYKQKKGATRYDGTKIGGRLNCGFLDPLVDSEKLLPTFTVKTHVTANSLNIESI